VALSGNCGGGAPALLREALTRAEIRIGDSVVMMTEDAVDGPVISQEQCGSRRATGKASTQSSVNGGVMCQIVSTPAGREARSPGLSMSVGPPAISMVTSPWSTWIVSRWTVSTSSVRQRW
jgi:hypothetical protein